MPAVLPPSKPRGVDVVEAFAREHALFLAFWGAVVLLGSIEFLAPQHPGEADRKRRWFTNFGLGILNGLIVSAVPAATVAAALWAQESHFGLLNWLAVPWWTALIVTVLVRSLAQYTFHVLCHKAPLLWRLHRVHHSDVHLDVSSALRNHPLEVIINFTFLVLVIAICGLSPVVLAAYETAELFANMLTHANLRVPDGIERVIRPLFVTPGLHRLHHSPLQIETDSNYGNVFSFWDRACGTYRGETIQHGPALRFGLDEVSGDRASDLQAQLVLPWNR
jgi:sterol desaturase/sphingolipid hydroxylase (fatty acid hydroxylase superfamily)